MAAHVKRTRGAREAADEASRSLRRLHVDDDGDDVPSSSAGEALDQSKRPRLQEHKRKTFQTIASRLREKLKQQQMFGIDVNSTFEAFDNDADGMIEIEEFAKALEAMGFELTASELGNLQRIIDQDRDGLISYEEFCRFVGDSMPPIDEAGDGAGGKPRSSRARRNARERSHSMHSQSGPSGDEGASGGGDRSGRSPKGDDTWDAAGGAGAGAGAGERELTFHQAKVALACASSLGRLHRITDREKARLKDRIVRSDARVAAATAVFDDVGDPEDLLDTLCRIARID